VRPEIARRITPVDMNIVYQRMDAADPNQNFDLIIGTNIFIYYGAFEQSLARANLAAMLKPGGFVLSNDLLADKVPSRLEQAHVTTIDVRSDPQIIEHVYCYRRQP
jgi:chemotaxis methyl-accepting protein methylase